MAQHTGAAAHPPFRKIDGGGDADLIIICDHASNAVPPELGDLGLPPEELARHIAWDIGAARIAEMLAQRFRAPAVLCGTSRLVIDCNRDPGDPAAMPTVSDDTVIPGNRNLGIGDRTERIARCFMPYHDAIERAIEAMTVRGREPVILSIHSMTPVMGGIARPWPIAVSWVRDDRLARPMLAALRRRTGQPVGDNEPYALDLKEDFSIPVHALDPGFRHLQVEFRQDLVADDAGAALWAALFGAALSEVLG